MTINVTKTYLPPLEHYVEYLERIWASGWVTNNGALVQELEAKLALYLDVPYVQFVSNGTIALQLALRALDVKGEVITTPFSYAATSNAILWEACTPVFVDIEPDRFCIDSNQIEAAISTHTSAILAVHVYGFPCRVDRIASIARQHDLKVVYDAAHAFGCRLKNTSLANYGDLSTISFHATKLFHTVEGGAIIAHTPEMAERLWLLKSFGHRQDDYREVGINGKNSEIHAAMGLCLLPKMDELISERRALHDSYRQCLADLPLRFPIAPDNFEYNYAYFPVVFESEGQLIKVTAALNENSIFPRRYFYPPLNRLPFLQAQACPVAEDISPRVLCLPFYNTLTVEEVKDISNIIARAC